MGVFLIQKSSELNKQKELVSNQKEQIRNLSVQVKNKDKEISSLKNKVSEKDKEIKNLNKKLNKKNTQEKKAKEEANMVAENGDYESEDTTGIVEEPGELAQGTVRTLTVSNSSKDSMTISIEETTTGGRHIDGIYDINVNLKNGKGSFSEEYEGWSLGNFTFDGELTVVNSKTIKIDCTSNSDWGSHTFTKK